MLNNDMKFIGADIDLTLTYEERVHDYEETWNRILNGKGGNAAAADLLEVIECEGQLGFRPAEQYARPPFSTIARLMKKEGLSTTDLGGFLRWKAKADNMEAARKAKKRKRAVTKPTQTILNWTTKRTGKSGSRRRLLSGNKIPF
jgi:hypothetical protein